MDEFEARLRAFKPRRPGPLPHPPKPRPAVWLLGATAAAVVIVVALGALARRNVAGPGGRNVAALVGRNPALVGRTFSAAARGAVARGGAASAVGVGPTVGSLTPLALSDPAAFDAELNRLSGTLLPDVEQPNRALSALGRNSK